MKTKPTKYKEINQTSKQTNSEFTDTTISNTLPLYRHDKLTDTVSLQNKPNQSKTVSLQTRYVHKTKETKQKGKIVSLQTHIV